MVFGSMSTGGAVRCTHQSIHHFTRQTICTWKFNVLIFFLTPFLFPSFLFFSSLSSSLPPLFLSPAPSSCHRDDGTKIFLRKVAVTCIPDADDRISLQDFSDQFLSFMRPPKPSEVFAVSNSHLTLRLLTRLSFVQPQKPSHPEP